jgi:hypothetical protein
MIRNFLILTVGILSLMNIEAQSTNANRMSLTVLADYGGRETVIADSATAEEIRSTMAAIDWQQFHQVILVQVNKDWLEVGGSTGDNGFSVVYEETGKQYIIVEPPKSVNELTEILLNYLDSDNNFKKRYRFR